MKKFWNSKGTSHFFMTPFHDLPLLYTSEDKLTIIRAYEFAKHAHQEQKRSSGEEYITHPVAVSKILLNLHVKADIIVIALLHDTLEDTKASFKDLEEKFGFEIAKTVNALTHTKIIGNIHDLPEAKRREKHYLFLDTIKDPKAALVRIADRLHNMRTIEFLSIERQHNNALETVKMIAPLAKEIGVHGIEEELLRISKGILSSEDFESAREKSQMFQKEIQEKGYFKNKMQEQCIEQGI